MDLHQTAVPASPAVRVLQGANLPFVYLPIAAVIAAVGLSTARIYALIKAGEFPRGDLIGSQSRRWKSTEIASWLLDQASKAAQREMELSGSLREKSQDAANKSAAKRRANRDRKAVMHVAS